MSSKDMDKVEQVQVQCLRRTIGAKTHSSSIAVDVITGTLPMRLCIRDLCCREYFRNPNHWQGWWSLFETVNVDISMQGFVFLSSDVLNCHE